MAQVIGFEYLSSYILLSRFSREDWDTVSVVPDQIQRKLNYFSFCQIFEILFSICAKILIKSKVQLSAGHTRLFHNHEERLFIILYIHYLLKFQN
jgi:hypothetical protein